MVLSRTFEPPDLVLVDVAGLITPRDQAVLVEWAREMLEIVREVRLLVVLHDFGGWKPDAAFGDTRLWLQDSDRVSKMAIVGDAHWRMSILAFIAQPVRQMPVEYFEEEAAARRWLGLPALDRAAFPG
jgi:hypothetical protein